MFRVQDSGRFVSGFRQKTREGVLNGILNPKP